MIRCGRIILQPNSSPCSLISKVLLVGSCDSFARALRLLCKSRLPPYLVPLHSAGDAPRLKLLCCKTEEAKSVELEESGCAGLVQTRETDVKKRRIMQNRIFMARDCAVETKKGRACAILEVDRKSDLLQYRYMVSRLLDYVFPVYRKVTKN